MLPLSSAEAPLGSIDASTSCSACNQSSSSYPGEKPRRSAEKYAMSAISRRLASSSPIIELIVGLFRRGPGAGDDHGSRALPTKADSPHPTVGRCLLQTQPLAHRELHL